MNGGQARVPITNEEKCFDKYARLMMKRWDYMKFSRKFPTLLDTIRTSMKRYAEIEIERYKVELKGSKDCPRAIILEIAKKHHDPMWDKVIKPTIKEPQRHEWVKNIKDTSDTDTTKRKRFARKPMVLETPYCQRGVNYVFYKTGLYYVNLGTTAHFFSNPFPIIVHIPFKPHRNIRRHRRAKI